MKVVLAKKTGFCFGVKRAVAMAEAELKKHPVIYSLGSIIHNRQVVEDLSKQGLQVIDSASRIRKGVVVISSHGISPRLAAKIRGRGIRIVDTTCPFVLNAQRIAKKLSGAAKGRVVIVGDANHPEVRALVDFVPRGAGAAIVVKDRREAGRLRFRPGDRVSVISQTTQSTGNFLETVEAIAEREPLSLKVVNTICRDAEDRQEAARQLARKVDVMVIIGGRNSANTRRLFEVSKEICRSSHHIETAEDLRRSWFKRSDTVGITSGASTPDSVIEQVVQTLHNKNKRKGRL